MKRFCIPVALLLLLSACDKETETPPCGPVITPWGEALIPPHGDDFGLYSAEVSGHCLTVEIGTSGCSSAYWTVELLTHGIQPANLPPGVTATLSLDDGVAEDAPNCLALVSETYSFDLRPYTNLDLEHLYLVTPGRVTTLPLN